MRADRETEGDGAGAGAAHLQGVDDILGQPRPFDRGGVTPPQGPPLRPGRQDALARAAGVDDEVGGSSWFHTSANQPRS
ncbi:hypothetical protein GCM10010274_60520 [Streptomyces lavendofoliae]|uniref:Uncharacterized protein n=1 Tax=Streptomyces lavendofoliae TaxID=67314 RepID=A0A918M773_9ACTN|nr:hypothetical protein GCM10010274_60520 [Streptomyces lavendofoliae]